MALSIRLLMLIQNKHTYMYIYVYTRIRLANNFLRFLFKQFYLNDLVFVLKSISIYWKARFLLCIICLLVQYYWI